jgi:hypothetical protein
VLVQIANKMGLQRNLSTMLADTNMQLLMVGRLVDKILKTVCKEAMMASFKTFWQ